MFSVMPASRPWTVATLAATIVLTGLAVACGGGSSGSPPSPAEQDPNAETVEQSQDLAEEADVADTDEPLAEAPAQGAEQATPATPAETEADDEAAATSVWQTLAPLAAGPRQETAVVALNGEIYVIGGFDGRRRIVPTVEAYDPENDRWRPVADLPEPLHHANAAVAGGKIYVLGFLTGPFVADGRTLIYDPEADAWSVGQPMPPGTERGASAVAVLAGRIYVAGGLRSGAVDDFSVYDGASDSWGILPDLPAARDHLVGGGIAGLIYVAGGRGGAIDAVVGRLDVFDPATSRWSTQASMPTPRGGAASAVADGRLYVIGGEGNPAAASGVFAEVEAYDPETDHWTSLPAPPTPRHGTGAAALLGQIYVPGGATQQGFGAVATNERLTP